MRYLVNVFNAIVTVLWAVWVKLMLPFVGILAQLFINFKNTRIVFFFRPILDFFFQFAGIICIVSQCFLLSHGYHGDQFWV